MQTFYQRDSSGRSLPSSIPLFMDSNPIPPAAQSDQRPDDFNQTEWPLSLKETIGRCQQARPGECQEEPWAPALLGVTGHPGVDGDEAE